MKLVGDDELERSAVVANCRMNRERGLSGSNGYDRELGFHPLDILKRHLADDQVATWFDLCCGSGKALIEAADVASAEGLNIEIVGVDLVGMFNRPGPDTTCLRLLEASLTTWQPDLPADLITCVHGLHYIGDKLGLISRAASWLTEDGLFVANLDLANLRFPDGRGPGRRITTDLRRAGLEYDGRKRLVACRGRRVVKLLYRYLGADDRAGPNYTGQPAVNSFYEPLNVETDPAG
jgi:SAM-dependent methyltransferase